MKDRNERKIEARKWNAAAAIMTLVMAGSGVVAMGRPAAAPQAGEKEKQMATAQSKFFCNTKALSPEERARHKQMSEKLIATRRATVESEKGYEFQFSPKDISIGELAEWVVAESKCCPFFDFHIDLEQAGNLLCLRLTGEEGVKVFIRSEFSEAWSSQQR